MYKFVKFKLLFKEFSYGSIDEYIFVYVYYAFILEQNERIALTLIHMMRVNNELSAL